MKKPIQHRLLTVLLTASCAFLGTATKSRAQVTFEQVTNGLVDFYPLDTINPDGKSTPDFVGGRDLLLTPAVTSSNLVASTHPGGAVSNCFNLPQAGGQATALYYESKGQDPLTGAGDFLPFCNQRGASMNFWVRSTGGAGTYGGDKRIFGEADTTGGAGDPLWLIGSSSGTADSGAHWLLRHSGTAGAPAGSTLMGDGTYQLPAVGYYWTQGGQYTVQPVLDDTWHMLTVTVDTNGNCEVYVDAVRDTGSGTVLDIYGSNATLSVMPVTNLFYTTNDYPLVDPPTTNPPPDGYVRWMMNGLYNHGSTVFGGFKRGGVTAGLPIQVDDIGFWKRVLAPDEIMFVMTNGLPGIQPDPLVPRVNSFSVDLPEVGQGDSVGLNWNVSGQGVTINISGVGDVTALGNVGSTNVPLTGNQTYTFNLTVHQPAGGYSDATASTSVKTFPGVSSDWHLIQRFDGVFDDTTQGIGADTAHANLGWVSAQSSYVGNFDRWNVVTLTNGGGQNKVLTPRPGYYPDASSATGWDSRGALAYAHLNGLTITPGHTNTLFFRFSLHDPESQVVTLGGYSGMDAYIGLTEFNFWAGPVAGTAATAQFLGPYINIVRSDPSFLLSPFNLQAYDYSGSGITNTYSYLDAVDPNGLQTNVNYMVWMNVEDYNTMEHDNGDGTTNTINMPVFSAYLQKQGDANRTLLFSGYHGDRDFNQANLISGANPGTPNIDKVFFNIGAESITAGTPGAYFDTNMIKVDDIYLSKNGVSASIPRLFDITSIKRDAGSVTIQWNSLGSLDQVNTYSIQRTTSLNPTSWTTLTSAYPSGGNTTTFTDSNPPPGPAYYRISWP